MLYAATASSITNLPNRHTVTSKQPCSLSQCGSTQVLHEYSRDITVYILIIAQWNEFIGLDLYIIIV